MDPLIITATANICWLEPDVPYPKSPAEIATEARLCQERGATICHTHAEGHWAEAIQTIRGECDIIIQCGMSSMQIDERMDAFVHGSDMISIMLNHHDEAFAGQDIYVLHPRRELEAYMDLCTRYHVKPEFEVWHTGSIWNLKYLLEKGLVQPPTFATLFFGWPGGAWSPPTVEEYLARRKQMPAGSVVNVSIMGPEQIEILAAAIVRGDHVRVGTEDYPFLAGRVAATHDLVAAASQIARSVGRPVATVAEARAMLDM